MHALTLIQKIQNIQACITVQVVMCNACRRGVFYDIDEKQESIRDYLHFGSIAVREITLIMAYIFNVSSDHTINS